MKVKSIKQCLLTIIIVMIVGGVLCSCKTTQSAQSNKLLNADGTVNQNYLIGKWYNKDDVCLDIRENGKYKLYGDYGLGSWIILDDKSTVEFSDFYGEIIDSSVGEDNTGFYIYLKNYGGNYYKNSDGDSASEAVEQDENSIVVTKAYDYSDGLAWAIYNKDNTEYCGLIDETGKILYGEIYENQIFHKPRGSLTYVEENGNYKLINSTGKVVLSTDNGDIDKILAVGDGKALVYKYNGNIDTSENLYGVIDCDGNWVQPLKDWGFNISDRTFMYAGEGVFMAYTGSSFQSGSVFIFNSNDSSNMFLDKINTKTTKLSNTDQYAESTQGLIFDEGITFLDAGSSVSDCTSFWQNVTDFSKLNDNGKITDNFILKANGEYEETEYYLYGSSGKLFRDNDEQLEFTDYSNNKKVTITDYPASKIESVVFSDTYGIMTILGEDNNLYFTLIDENGKIKFEPIKFSGGMFNNTPAIVGVLYSSGKIVVTNDDKTFSIYDESGNVLASNLQYKYIGEFDNDIAVATDSEKNTFYINSEGEKILTTLTE